MKNNKELSENIEGLFEDIEGLFYEQMDEKIWQKFVWDFYKKVERKFDKDFIEKLKSSLYLSCERNIGQKLDKPLKKSIDIRNKL